MLTIKQKVLRDLLDRRTAQLINKETKMSKVKQSISTILGKLPFNGFKSGIGFLLLNILPIVPIVIPVPIPGLPVTIPIPAHAIVAALAGFFGTTGVVHAIAKK